MNTFKQSCLRSWSVRIQAVAWLRSFELNSEIFWSPVKLTYRNHQEQLLQLWIHLWKSRALAMSLTLREENFVVIDVGSYLTKAGIGANDTNKPPSVVRIGKRERKGEGKALFLH